MTEQEKKAPQPMDPAAREEATPSRIITRARDCYAVTTLITEVQAIYPDVEVQTFAPNGRSVSLGVAFYDDTEPDLALVLALLGDSAHNVDPRIESVGKYPAEEDEEQGYTAVEFRNNPTTYDLRDPFGIGPALDVLNEDEEEEDPDSNAKDGHYIYRSSVSGKIVTEGYALKNPDKTQREWVEDTDEEQ